MLARKYMADPQGRPLFSLAFARLLHFIFRNPKFFIGILDVFIEILSFFIGILLCRTFECLQENIWRTHKEGPFFWVTFCTTFYPFCTSKVLHNFWMLARKCMAGPRGGPIFLSGFLQNFWIRYWEKFSKSINIGYEIIRKLYIFRKVVFYISNDGPLNGLSNGV